MKKLGFFFAAFCLSACNVVGGSHEAANDRFIREQNQSKAQNEVTYAGGQPGKITVNGIVVEKNGDKAQIDDRIKITQRLGKSEVLSAPVATLAESSGDAAITRTLSKTVSKNLPANLRSDKSFVALGCDSSSLAEIAGLSEAKPTSQNDNYSISANTVVLCGKIDLPFSQVSISAQNLYLKNASLSVKAGPGTVAVAADKISLEGKNKLETLGLDANSFVPQAPSLELDVLQSIDGDGSLKLHSQGGNCKKPGQ